MNSALVIPPRTEHSLELKEQLRGFTKSLINGVLTLTVEIEFASL